MRRASRAGAAAVVKAGAPPGIGTNPPKPHGQSMSHSARISTYSEYSKRRRGHPRASRDKEEERATRRHADAIRRSSKSTPRVYSRTGGVHFISKPFTLDQLAAKMRAVPDE